jgi:hypothetical protein
VPWNTAKRPDRRTTVRSGSRRMVSGIIPRLSKG